MTRLQLVPTGGAGLAEGPRRANERPARDSEQLRPRRAPPHLSLVADTGSQYRGRSARAPTRRHNWLTLAVASAAVAAAVLVSSASFAEILGPAAAAATSPPPPLPFRSSSPFGLSAAADRSPPNPAEKD